MHNEKQRGIGAVLIAMGAVGMLLWLAVARLDQDTAISLGGLIAALLFGCLVLGGIHLIRKNR